MRKSNKRTWKEVYEDHQWLLFACLMGITLGAFMAISFTWFTISEINDRKYAKVSNDALIIITIICIVWFVLSIFGLYKLKHVSPEKVGHSEYNRLWNRRLIELMESNSRYYAEKLEEVEKKKCFEILAITFHNSKISFMRNALNSALAAGAIAPAAGANDIVAAVLAGTAVAGPLGGIAAGAGVADGIKKQNEQYKEILVEGAKAKEKIKDDRERMESCFKDMLEIIAKHATLLDDWRLKMKDERDQFRTEYKEVSYL